VRRGGWEEGRKATDLKLIITSFLPESLTSFQFILLSSTGANATSYSPYMKMKVSFSLNISGDVVDGQKRFELVAPEWVELTSSFFSLAVRRVQGELEEAVKGLGFKRTFILHPGLLVGARDHTRTLEGAAQGLFKGLRAVGFPLLDRAGVDAEV